MDYLANVGFLASGNFSIMVVFVLATDIAGHDGFDTGGLAWARLTDTVDFERIVVIY
jgi:hypothetical protein